MKVRHVSAETRRTGPVRSVVSRTTTPRAARSGVVLATSTQAPPLLPLWVLLRQAPTSTQSPPLLPL